MNKTILVGSSEIEVTRWNEGPPIYPAGVSSTVQDAQEEVMMRQGVEVLRPRQAAFDSPVALAVQTGFTLKEDGRRFFVTDSGDPRHQALQMS